MSAVPQPLSAAPTPVSAAPRRVNPGLDVERVYVWELPVRLVHWLLFFSILILAFTGYYIGHPFISVPGPAHAHFVMARMREVHIFTSIAFTLLVLVRVYWAFAGNRYARWSELIPVTMRRLRSFKKAFLFYTFLSREPVEYLGHNGLAGLTYAAIFGVYFLVMLTGFALYTVYASLGSPMRWFTFLIPVFGGLQVARLIHHIGMWLILIFAVAHVYFVVLYSIVERVGIFDSIISGYKFKLKKPAKP